MQKIWKALALAVAVLLALAACASAGDGGVATLGGGDGTASGSSASPSVDPEDALAEFAECMRENGIEDFPDPTIDEDGGISIDVGGEGRPSEEDRERIDAAMEACQDLLPQSEGPRISEEDQAAFQDALIEYAECMREHGIEDFPDPEFTEGGAFQEIGEGIDPNSEEFQAADEACRPALEDVLPGRGEVGVTNDEDE